LGENVADFMIHILPIYVGWVFIVTQVILLWRRFSLESTKLVSLPNDYIALILLLIKSILGQGMRLFPYEAISSEFYDVVFIPRFVVLHLEKIPSYHWFNLHIIFTQLFIMYLPYSKIIHTITGVITSAIYGSRRKQFGI
jgi:nitrate reductase gamma subunit